MIPRAVIVGLTVLLLGGTRASAQNTAACDELVGFLQSPGQMDVMERFLIHRKIQALAFEADSTCFPRLETEFRTGAEYLKSWSAMAILYIGGPTAAPLLRELSATNPAALPFLLQASGIVGTPEDVEVLLAALTQQGMMGGFWGVGIADMTLRFLRPEAARHALLAIADRNLPGVEVQRILPLLGQPRCSGESPAGVPARTAVIWVVLSCRPNYRETEEHCDWEQPQVWFRSGSGWGSRAIESCQAFEGDDDFRSFVDWVHVSVNGSRAAVDMRVNCGPRCGGGYTSTLRQIEGRWVIETMSQTFVS